MYIDAHSTRISRPRVMAPSSIQSTHPPSSLVAVAVGSRVTCAHAESGASSTASREPANAASRSTKPDRGLRIGRNSTQSLGEPVLDPEPVVPAAIAARRGAPYPDQNYYGFVVV